MGQTEDKETEELVTVFLFWAGDEKDPHGLTVL